MEEDVGRKTSELVLLIYVLQTRQEVEQVTSWVEHCDATSVNRRFIRGSDRKPEA